MKKNFILGYFFLVPVLALSQSQWQYLENAPVIQNGRFDDIYFISDSTGWAVNGLGEIYKTSDAGESWTLQLDTTQYLRTIEFIDDHTGFTGSLNGAVYKTSDAGGHWARMDHTFPTPVPGVCGISHAQNNMIMVGRWDGPAFILLSADSGKTWSHRDMSSFASALVDCWYKTKDTLFVSGRKSPTQSGIILRSVDAGINWEEVTPGGVPDGIIWKLQFVNGSVGYASIWESAGSKTHILKTTNGGKSYQVIQALDKNIACEAIGFINEREGWIGGWSPGMYRTVDGGLTWSYVNRAKNLNKYFVLRENLAYAAGESIYRFAALITAAEESVPGESFVHTMDVFPNPSSSNYIDVQLSLNVATMAVVEVYDMNGQFVSRIFKKALPAGLFNYRLATEKLLPGNYIVVLMTNEHSVRKKVVVTN
jgi:photosystem II stability/assembly factor-like uncharacterized protein